ncbi:MAG TPA: alpha/beta hydrolase [Terracidiphilus sp.]|nr:alpha/beta hydrolase [Terracidiphilus sp.]
MKRLFRLDVSGLVAATVISAALCLPRCATAEQSAAQLAAGLGHGFKSSTAHVNGIDLHYVRGGSGPAVILIHGFPEDWYEFRKVMPLLADRFDVIAVDLRGVGGSTATESGYDAANLATDIHELVHELHLDRPYIFGHDIGGMVAYAYARQFSNDARGVMMLDVALAGVGPWQEIKTDPNLWHIYFHQIPGLAEQLVTGRQSIYLGHFLSFPAFSDEDRTHFYAAYGDGAHLRAAFEFYRAFPAEETNNANPLAKPCSLPLVFGAGERDVFHRFVPREAQALRDMGWQSVSTDAIANSIHYVVDEQPQAVAELIASHAAQHSEVH